MSRILHLSDIHLGQPGTPLEDLKEKILSQSELTTHQVVLGRALQDVKREQDPEPLDAVVITGDISWRASDAGFASLEDLLSLLGDVRPSADRILVVPGNHDVVWRTPSSDHERYRKYLAVTRQQGMATPLIDGVDFDPGNISAFDPANCGAAPVLEGNDFVIVGLNSSNWCGVLADYKGSFGDNDWEQALGRLDPTIAAAARESLLLLREHDVARVAFEQLQALDRYLEWRNLSKPDGRVRVLALHHHLFPVSSAEEEVKTFESITNLATVREFIVRQHFHLILHGHKHRGAVYVDAGTLPKQSLSERHHRIFVIAAPGLASPGKEALRVLDIVGESSAHTLALNTVQARTTPGGRPEIDRKLIPIWTAEQGPSLNATIRGKTRDDVYGRIKELFRLEDTSRFVSTLVSTIEDASSATRIPATYPHIDHPDEGSWFDQRVDWWQRPQSRLLESRRFNHGQRLGDRYGDQLKRCASVLDDDPNTSRAIAVLIDPATEAGMLRARFPAFVFAQFQLARTGTGRRLDVTGVFRKQEMDYWWPINVAELRVMQERVREELDVLGSKVPAGWLQTISIMAYQGSDIPDVDVAELDLAVDQPERFARLAAGLVAGDADGGARAEWDLILSELKRLRGGKVAVALLGWKELVKMLRLVEVLSPERISPVRKAVEEIAGHTEVASPERAPERFLASMHAAVARAEEAVEAALRVPGNPEE